MFIFIEYIQFRIKFQMSTTHDCFHYIGQIPGMMPPPLPTLTARKSMKIKFLANKVYHNFSQDIQRLQICKIPKLRMGTLMTLIEHVI